MKKRPFNILVVLICCLLGFLRAEPENLPADSKTTNAWFGEANSTFAELFGSEGRITDKELLKKFLEGQKESEHDRIRLLAFVIHREHFPADRPLGNEWLRELMDVYNTEPNEPALGGLIAGRAPSIQFDNIKLIVDHNKMPERLNTELRKYLEIKRPNNNQYGKMRGAIQSFFEANPELRQLARYLISPNNEETPYIVFARSLPPSGDDQLDSENPGDSAVEINEQDNQERQETSESAEQQQKSSPPEVLYENIKRLESFDRIKTENFKSVCIAGLRQIINEIMALEGWDQLNVKNLNVKKLMALWNEISAIKEFDDQHPLFLLSKAEEIFSTNSYNDLGEYPSDSPLYRAALFRRAEIAVSDNEKFEIFREMGVYLEGLKNADESIQGKLNEISLSLRKSFFPEASDVSSVLSDLSRVLSFIYPENTEDRLICENFLFWLHYPKYGDDEKINFEAYRDFRVGVIKQITGGGHDRGVDIRLLALWRQELIPTRLQGADEANPIKLDWYRSFVDFWFRDFLPTVSFEQNSNFLNELAEVVVSDKFIRDLQANLSNLTLEDSWIVNLRSYAIHQDYLINRYEGDLMITILDRGNINPNILIRQWDFLLSSGRNQLNDLPDHLKLSWSKMQSLYDRIINYSEENRIQVVRNNFLNLFGNLNDNNIFHDDADQKERFRNFIFEKRGSFFDTDENKPPIAEALRAFRLHDLVLQRLTDHSNNESSEGESDADTNLDTPLGRARRIADAFEAYERFHSHQANFNSTEPPAGNE